MVAISTAGWVAARNEECVYCDDEAGLYAIADGVGRGNAADAAARIFCETVRAYRERFAKVLAAGEDERARRTRALALMQEVFNRAAERIYRMAQRRAGYGGMATTGVVLAVGPIGAVIGHVGDSRAYLMRGGELRRLTQDHTYGNPESGDATPGRMALSRTIGQTPSVQADTVWLEVGEGDTIPLCSFGLYRAFDDRELLSMMQAGIDRAIRAARERTRSDDDESSEAGMLVRLSAATYGSEELDTRSIIECVRRVRLFRYLTDQELIRLLKIVYQRRLQPGDVLCDEGEPGDALYVVYSGSLDVSKSKHHLVTLTPGSHLGEVAFVDGGARSATVVALERSTVLTFNREDFGALGRSDPVLSAKVLWAIALHLGARLRDLTDRFANLVDE